MPRQVITFHYNVKDEQGSLLDSSKGRTPVAFLEGSGQIIPGLETALLPLEKGISKEIVVPYAEAYGAYDQSLVATVPRSNFPTEEIKAGDLFQVEREGTYRVVQVVEVKEDAVVIDANHPLAGKNLTFWIEIVDRREATPEEIGHGHVHGPEGHHHH